MHRLPAVVDHDDSGAHGGQRSGRVARACCRRQRLCQVGRREEDRNGFRYHAQGEARGKLAVKLHIHKMGHDPLRQPVRPRRKEDVTCVVEGVEVKGRCQHMLVRAVIEQRR